MLARHVRISLPVVLLIFSVFWVSVKIAHNDLRDISGHDPSSVTVALNLLDHGVFSHQRYDDRPSMPVPQTRGGPPGYGIALAGMGLIAPSLKPLLRCYARLWLRCALPFEELRPAVIMQGAFALLSLVLIFFAAWGYSRSIDVAGLTVFLTAVFGDFEHFSLLLRPGILLYLGFAAGLCFAALFCRTDRPMWAFVASVWFGLTALVQPTYGIAALLSAVLMVCVAGQASSRRGTSAATELRSVKFLTVLACGLGLALTVGAWSVYMHALFGDPWPTEGHFGAKVAMRVAFTRLETATILSSLVYWLPSHGDSLAQLTLPSSVYAPLAPWSEGSLELVGHQVIWPAAVAAAGSKAEAFSYLVTTSVLTDLFWHALTSVPLFLRGLFGAGHLLGLLCLLLLPSFFQAARVRRRGTEAGLIIVPLGSTLLWQAVLTSNPTDLCLPVVFVCAYVVGDRLGSI